MLTLPAFRRWRGAVSSLLAVATVALAACSDSSSTAPLRAADDASLNRSGSHGPSDAATSRAGAVYTLTNAAAGNGVVAFRREYNLIAQVGHAVVDRCG